MTTPVELYVLLDHHEGQRAYAREVDWSMPVPEVGERVVLGPGLVSAAVVRRVFVPDGQRVGLVFTLGPTDSQTWPDALEAAGYERGDDPPDLR